MGKGAVSPFGGIDLFGGGNPFKHRKEQTLESDEEPEGSGENYADAHGPPSEGRGATSSSGHCDIISDRDTMMLLSQVESGIDFSSLAQRSENINVNIGKDRPKMPMKRKLPSKYKRAQKKTAMNGSTREGSDLMTLEAEAQSKRETEEQARKEEMAMQEQR